MTVLGIDIDLTTDYLEERYEDEAKCESTHIHGRTGAPYPCSISVVAKASHCRRSDFLVCQSYVEHAHRRLADEKGAQCCCGRPLEACWTLVPV